MDDLALLKADLRDEGVPFIVVHGVKGVLVYQSAKPENQRHTYAAEGATELEALEWFVRARQSVHTTEEAS